MPNQSDLPRLQIKPDTKKRSTLKRLGVVAGAGIAAQLASGLSRVAHAASGEPIKIGMQLHRTGIGASYGRWYERVASAGVKLINEEGGINGRPVELIVEDDGTDPKRGAEVVEKFAALHKVDVAYGTLFSHVVIGSSPRAGELKLPYVVVSEGHHVASGSLNRYVFQPGITDVRSQVISMAPWISQNLGKKVTMIFPDFAFGHDHRDYFSQAIQEQGGEVAWVDSDSPYRVILYAIFTAYSVFNRSALSRYGGSRGSDLCQRAGPTLRQ